MAQLGSLQDNDRASFKIIDDGGVDEIARRVDAPLVNDGLADVNANLDSIETKLDTVNSNLDSIETKVDTTNLKLDDVLTNQEQSLSYERSLVGYETFNLTGILTTTTTVADQQIIAVTVPLGKDLFLLGWSIYTGNSGATVVKLGKNTPLTETTNPGVVNGVVFRAFGLPDVGRDGADYAVPRKFATAGDSVRMTVTPSKTATTTWRASIDYVLRDIEV